MVADATAFLIMIYSLVAARSTRSLSERRITHVLSVCADLIPAELPQSGIRHMRIPIEDVDYADLLIHLPSACQFIDNAIRSGGRILVHDVQASRTPFQRLVLRINFAMTGCLPQCGCCCCLS